VATHRELAQRVGAMTGALAAALTLACGLLMGAADALGALVGSGLTLLNFGGLAWAADRASGDPAGSPARGRLLWVGASGIRLAAFAVAVGVALSRGGLGVVGLLLSLLLVPVAVILAGLTTAARAA
jgi:hypothetical protein